MLFVFGVLEIKSVSARQLLVMEVKCSGRITASREEYGNRHIPMREALEKLKYRYTVGKRAIVVVIVPY